MAAVHPIEVAARMCVDGWALEVFRMASVAGQQMVHIVGTEALGQRTGMSYHLTNS